MNGLTDRPVFSDGPCVVEVWFRGEWVFDKIITNPEDLKHEMRRLANKWRRIVQLVGGRREVWPKK